MKSYLIMPLVLAQKPIKWELLGPTWVGVKMLNIFEMLWSVSMHSWRKVVFVLPNYALGVA